jgi:O-antigen ligase
MFAEHPLFGVGLDNFLYAYRGRYILESGWEEPNLNHPHNIILDFATRLGVAGLLAGAWLVFTLIRMLWRLPKRVSAEWRPIAIGISGSVAQMLAHGSVDHSFFLVDLSFAFFLLLALAVWLQPINRVTFDARTG